MSMGILIPQDQYAYSLFNDPLFISLRKRLDLFNSADLEERKSVYLTLGRRYMSLEKNLKIKVRLTKLEFVLYVIRVRTLRKIFVLSY